MVDWQLMNLLQLDILVAFAGRWPIGRRFGELFLALSKILLPKAGQVLSSSWPLERLKSIIFLEK